MRDKLKMTCKINFNKSKTTHAHAKAKRLVIHLDALFELTNHKLNKTEYA